MEPILFSLHPPQDRNMVRGGWGTFYYIGRHPNAPGRAGRVSSVWQEKEIDVDESGASGSRWAFGLPGRARPGHGLRSDGRRPDGGRPAGVVAGGSAEPLADVPDDAGGLPRGVLAHRNLVRVRVREDRAGVGAWLGDAVRH